MRRLVEQRGEDLVADRRRVRREPFRRQQGRRDRGVALGAQRPHGRGLERRRLARLDEPQERLAGLVEPGEAEQADRLAAAVDPGRGVECRRRHGVHDLANRRGEPGVARRHGLQEIARPGGRELPAHRLGQPGQQGGLVARRKGTAGFPDDDQPQQRSATARGRLASAAIRPSSVSSSGASGFPRPASFRSAVRNAASRPRERAEHRRARPAVRAVAGGDPSQCLGRRGRPGSPCAGEPPSAIAAWNRTRGVRIVRQPAAPRRATRGRYCNRRLDEPQGILADPRRGVDQRAVKQVVGQAVQRLEQPQGLDDRGRRRGGVGGDRPQRFDEPPDRPSPAAAGGPCRGASRRDRGAPRRARRRWRPPDRRGGGASGPRPWRRRGRPARSAPSSCRPRSRCACGSRRAGSRGARSSCGTCRRRRGRRRGPWARKTGRNQLSVLARNSTPARADGPGRSPRPARAGRSGRGCRSGRTRRRRRGRRRAGRRRGTPSRRRRR